MLQYDDDDDDDEMHKTPIRASNSFQTHHSRFYLISIEEEEYEENIIEINK